VRRSHARDGPFFVVGVPMRISLVINTYNRMHTLPNTLEAIQFLRYPDLEVLVVDGPSTDGTREYLQAFWQGQLKILTCEFANLSKSRNVGIQHATGDIVCFTDDDGIPEPDWLDQLVLAYADDKVAAAGGWVRNHTGVAYQTKYIVSTRNSMSEVMIESPEKLPECLPFAPKFPGLIGVNSSFRRTALLEVGGFDEEYAYYLDETDVILRLIDAGYRVDINPNAEVHHKYAPSHIRAPNGAARSWLQIMTSTVYYIIKAAPLGTKLSDTFKLVAEQKQRFIRETKIYLANGVVNQDKYELLLDEIEAGVRKGVIDAFAYPARQLIADMPSSEWLAFPRLLPAKQRLRIALVTALYPPQPCGGVAVFMHILATTLAAAGHEVTVITQASDNQPHTVDFEDRVWVHRLPKGNFLETVRPANMPEMPDVQRNMALGVLGEIDRVNARRSFDWVLGSIWDLDLAAVIASGRYRTAMYLVTSYRLMEASKPEWRTSENFYKNHVLKMVDAEAWAIRHVDCLLSSTQAILADTEQAYDLKVDERRLRLLPFGVRVPETTKSQNRVDGCVRLLFVGRFEYRKGIDLLLEVLPELLSRHKHLVVELIGDHTIPDADGSTIMKRFITAHQGCEWFNRIDFRGHVSDDALEAAYAQCDIFVAPSRYESFGLIFLEAMRFGVPCIGCDAGGMPEVVEDQVTGILVPPGDAPALSIAIEQLVTDQELRHRMGALGKQRFNENFTAEIFSRRLCDMLLSMKDREL
jgi:glycogen synthase